MRKFVMAAGVMAAMSTGSAMASTVDFSTNNGSTLSHGAFVDGRFDFGNGLTGTVSTTGGSGIAQVFDSSIRRSTWTNDPDLQRPRSVTDNRRTRELGNVLIVNENRNRVDDNARGGAITFVFDTVVSFFGVTLVDLEHNQPVTITADGYSSGPQSNADNYYSSFSLAQPIETRTLTFSFAGSGAIDNLQVAAVPVPAPALMLLGGLGALGALRRRTHK